MHSDKDLQGIKARLAAERDALATPNAAADAERKPVELDQQSVGRLSRMDAMQVQAMALESQRRRLLRIRRIDAAIMRIDRREYGRCARCGEDIAKPRLDADPTMPLCADCARGAGS